MDENKDEKNNAILPTVRPQRPQKPSSDKETKVISPQDVSQGVEKLISQLNPQSAKLEKQVVVDYLGKDGKKLIKHLKKAAELDRGPDFSRSLRNTLRALILQFAELFTQGHITRDEMGSINDDINQWAYAVLTALNPKSCMDEGSVDRPKLMKNLTRMFMAVHDGVHRVVSAHLPKTTKLHPWLAGLKHLFDFYSASRFLDLLCFSPIFASEKKAIYKSLELILQFRVANAHPGHTHNHTGHTGHGHQASHEPHAEIKKEKHKKEKIKKPFLIETSDGGVRKIRIIKEGEGWEMAEEDWTVCVQYAARCGGWGGSVLKDGWPQDSVKITLGQIIQPPGFTDGLEEAIKMMKKGETARFVVNSDYGFGKAGDSSLGVDANCRLYYEVSVISYSKPEKTVSHMRGQEKLNYAQGKKGQGNQYFKDKRYKKACEKYHLVLKCYDYEQRGIDSDNDIDDDSYPERVEPGEIHSLQIVCHSNLSMCYLRRKKYTTAIEHCDAVLNQESKDKNGDAGVYTKLWFRRGQAWLYNGDPEKALEDLSQAISMTENLDMKTHIHKFQTIAKRQIDKERKKQKKAYAGFFDKADSNKNKKDVTKEDEKQAIESGKEMTEDGKQEEDAKQEKEDCNQEDQEQDQEKEEKNKSVPKNNA